MKPRPRGKRVPKLERPRMVTITYLNLPDWRERLARVLRIVAPDLIGDPPPKTGGQDGT